MACRPGQSLGDRASETRFLLIESLATSVELIFSSLASSEHDANGNSMR